MNDIQSNIQSCDRTLHFEDPLNGFIAEVESNTVAEEVSHVPAPNRYAQLCEEAQLNIEDEVPAPPVAIFVGNSPACTLGNFSASIGKAKGKKTFNVSAMVAAALTNSTVLEYRGNMPSNQSVILYFDTEQSTYHAQRVFKRIARLTGFSHLEMKQRIQFFALRRYSVEDRIAMIDHKIRTTPNVGLVVIDGIRDLMLDINNPRESTVVVGLLMQWTEEHNLHVHTIIHQNKGDENARGHIGTEINNKAETVLKVEKDKQQESMSTVEAVFIRDIPFPPFAFQINGEALPELVEDYEPESKPSGKSAWDPYHDIPEATHRSVLNEVFPTDSTQLKRKELTQGLSLAFRGEGIVLSDHKLKQLITFYTNKTMIEQVNDGKTKGSPFRYNRDFYY